MSQIRPAHAIFMVLLFGVLVVVADYAIEGGFTRAAYESVSPDTDGQVVLEVGDLSTDEVRFYRFINAGNQEVKFFVGRDSTGVIQVAFDANAICYKMKRGYNHQDGWVSCNKCDKAFELAELNAGGGGCKPVPLEHRVAGDRLVLAETDILTGWRYFR